MIVTINEFCKNVSSDSNLFVKAVLSEVGVYTNEKSREFINTSASYSELSKMFRKATEKNPNFGDVQLCTNPVNLIAEYQLPKSSARCDVVLLGVKEGQRQVVIIENKNYDPKVATKSCGAEGLIERRGEKEVHPADQVQGYVDYCRYFHSVVEECVALVDGCVFFSQPVDLTPYKEAPNDELCEEFPLFNTETADGLADYILGKIEEGDEEFSVNFEKGEYKQNRNILKQVAGNISNATDERQFVLLEKQREGFNVVMNELKKCIDGDDKKKVIIVEGPPGSGKSAIAINLWAEAVKVVNEAEACGKKMEGNIVYVSTSQTQKENWKRLFKKRGRKRGAKNIVMAANEFNPGLNSTSCHDLGPKIRKMNPKYKLDDEEDYTLKREYYEEYTNILIDKGWEKGYRDNQHLLSIVDEAHALINPVANKFRSNNAGGWFFSIGPQAYHIIRQSKISVFLMDGEQSYRDNETTTLEDIKAFADKFGVDVISVSLEDMQFRCNGSKEYVNWATDLFKDKPMDNHEEWKEHFHVEVVDYPSEVEDYLRKKMAEGEDYVRLLSSYSRKWVSNGLKNDHSNGKEHDFRLNDKDGKVFEKYWNVNDYTAYVQAPEGTAMAKDPLSEVGCPYTVRGFDYDHIGLLWLSDMVWRDAHWMINIENVVEKGLKSPRLAAEKEQKDRLPRGKKTSSLGLVDAYNKETPLTEKLAKAMAQAYRILMTRAIKSVCIYIKDEETRQHVRSLLK